MSENELNSDLPAAPADAPAISEAPEATPHVTDADRTMEAVHDRMRPQRGEKGQFASTKPQQHPPGRPEGMPVSWGTNAAPIWQRLDAEARELVAQRETQAQQKISELGRFSKAGESLSTVIDRYRDLIGQNAPEQEIENFFQTKAALMRDPQGTLTALARQLGVNLGADAPAPANQQHLVQEALRHLDTDLQQHAQQQYQQTYQRAYAVREQFMRGKEDHWAELEPDMKIQAQAILLEDPGLSPKEILEMAYDRALKLNEHVRNRLSVPKAKEAEAQRIAETRRKAEEARRHMSLNVKSTSGATPKSAKTIEAEMEDVYDKMSARG